MGRKGNWISAVKKVLNSEPKEKNNEGSGKSKKKWYKKKKKVASNTPPPEAVPEITTAPPAQIQQSVVTPHTDPPRPSGAYKEPAKVAPTASTIAEPEKISFVGKEPRKHANSLALPTAKASEAVSVLTQVAADVACVTAVDNFVNESKEEMAVIKLQTAFRGYLARRTLCALRGLKRLQSVMQRQAVTRQTSNTLKCMQTLARMQSQIRERRLRMAEEINLVRQIQQKNAKEQAKELEKSQPRGNGWDASGKTKAETEATLRSKHEAAVRRERTLAYAYSHQQTWKTSEKYGTTLFLDNFNPHWGWSWLERWLAARPWENTTPLSNNQKSPHKPTLTTTGDEILKSDARRNNAARSSTSRLSTSVRSPSPKASPRMSVCVGG